MGKGGRLIEMKKYLPLLSLFFLSLSPPLKSELEEIHFASITSVVNYFQTIQAEIKTFISLTNISKCLYFIPLLQQWCFLLISRTSSKSF